MTRENDDSSSKVDIIDAIAKEIDMTSAIIAVIEILLRQNGADKYVQGAPATSVASSLSQPIGVGRARTATRTSFTLEDRLFLPAAKKETAPSLLGFAPIQRIEGK